MSIRFFSSAEFEACQNLIDLALVEDLATAGDVTSLAIIPEHLQGKAHFVCRAAGVIAGLDVPEILASLVPQLEFAPLKIDGDFVPAGTAVGVFSGPMRSILTMERTALNFMQRLSGVATHTRLFVEKLQGLKCQLLDTRKTTPAWRLLEKYAVRCGGGANHRTGLYDMILIKDNHLAALAHESNPIAAAIRSARLAYPQLPLEIEVDSLEQLQLALVEKPDFVLLDNMSPEQLRQAVNLRDRLAPQVLLEASGGIHLDTVREIAETGVDRISTGAVTHSSKALDIALDYG